MVMNKCVFNWSGGKDSSLSLYYLKQAGQYEVRYLLTSINEKLQRISMHGVRVELLRKQAQSIGIPLYPLLMPQEPTMEVYDGLMSRMLGSFKQEGIEYSVFGDIFLEDLKKYREEQLGRVGMKAVFPIWKRPTTDLAREFIDLGFKAVLVCVDERHLDRSFAGRPIDRQLLKDLPKGVDPCGENGEYHSFVYDGPIFSQPVPVTLGEVVYRTYQSPKDENDAYAGAATSISTGFWYQDLLP